MDTPPALSNYINLSSKTSTFASIDIVGSTGLKAGENEQDIVYTFLAYHRLVSQLAYDHHGEVISITGDGLMCRFALPEDGVRMTRALMDALDSFNKKQNHLTRPISIRAGVHTGAVLQSDDQATGALISQTIDLAAKLQEGAPPNGVRLSESTAALIKTLKWPLSKIGWDAALQMNVFELSGPIAKTATNRKLPDPVKVLIVESELDEILRLKKVLWTRQHESFPVYSTHQAALCLENWQPHLVMVSADLPWDTGWELLQAMRSDPAKSTIPVLLMSNHTTGQIIERSFSKGGNGFLRKPLDEQQILKRVEIALREFYL